MRHRHSIGDLIEMTTRWLVTAAAWAIVCCAHQATAQPSAGAPSDADLPRPVAPRTIVRQNGQVVVRAIRLAGPLTLDGRLDEAVYSENAPIDGFIQTVPNNGQPVSERTEAWVMFDDTNLYVTARLYESVPESQWVANEIRRDTNQMRQNDTFAVLLDTFHDRRNGFHFYTNALGGFTDQLVTDEGNPNGDWNPVWDVRAGRFDGGWTTEMMIPFKSLRYVSGTNQTWGLQLRRAIRRKNEWAHLTLLPAAGGGPNSGFRLSRAATLVGLDLPPQSANIDLKPYAIATDTTDRARVPALSNDLTSSIGGDMKYGITSNLTADITVRTDFAQVEVDEQQLNLTRFSLQFPEKRDFFLEGRGIFDFGRAGGSSGASLGFGSGGNSTPVTGAPTFFYSRRIGLDGGRVVPIRAGGRVTGRVGKWTVGALNIETGDEPVNGLAPTNFTVARIKRNILRRSSIGGIISNRDHSTLVKGSSNLAYGVDGLFSFFNDLSLGGYFANSEVDGRTTNNSSYQAKFDYAPDTWGVRADYLVVGANYSPEVGFTNRSNFRRSYAGARYSPRPKRSKRVRKYTTEGSYEYLVTDTTGRLETRAATGRFVLEQQSSDMLTVVATNHYEFLSRPFTVNPGVTIPIGGYTFNDVTTTYGFGAQRRLSGSLQWQTGHFYNGDINAVSFSTGRFAIRSNWSLEPTFTVNHVSLPAGTFTNAVLVGRTDYGFSPRRFMSALVQYSSSTHVLSSNFRFRWEYRPGSELIVVYTDERDTLKPGYPDLRNRAFVVKVNRLVRF
ncbi:MAG TPA: DUF5916 domain-containing protein [Vicinamibacterales bacterium]|nr:DUF5916 domain-containing protein [Vicinamibacterales bacterium]